MGRKIKVFCKKTGQEFSSFKEAGQELEVDAWTLSKKIETNGFFVDKYGHRWERETPMETKNKYKKTTPYYKKMKKRLFSHRKANEKKQAEERMQGCVDLRDVNFMIPKPIDLSSVKEALANRKKECPELVKQALRLQIKSLLMQSPLWETVKESMEYCGLNEITITTNKKD